MCLRYLLTLLVFNTKFVRLYDLLDCSVRFVVNVEFSQVLV
jgi:hypothetical protein